MDDRSISFKVKSRFVSHKLSPTPTPGKGFTSKESIEANFSTPNLSAKDNVISWIGSRSRLPLDGEMLLGAAISVTRVCFSPLTVMVKRVRAGQGTVGRNCKVLASNQRYSPGWSGLIWSKSPGSSTGPPPLGPVFSLKKTVMGSYPLKKISGTTVVPLEVNRGFGSPWPRAISAMLIVSRKIVSVVAFFFMIFTCIVLKCFIIIIRSTP